MQITVNETDMKIEDGKLIINIDSDLEKLLGINNVVLSSVEPGKVIKGKTGRKYIVFRHKSDGVTQILRKDLLEDDVVFDDNSNNLAISNILGYLNTTYIKEIKEDFGSENIMKHETDLLSLDGLDDYRTIKSKVSLRTLDDYRYGRKNKIVTDDANLGRIQWLATPNSTPSGTGARYVLCVGSSGDVDYDGCGWCCGVRPFFSLRSSILVSCQQLEGQ